MDRPIALTLGDPAGIGPEIVVKAFMQESALTQGCFVVGDASVVRDAARILARNGIAPATVVIDRPSEAMVVPPRSVPVLQATVFSGPLEKGRISALAGRFAGLCIQAASKLALQGEVQAVVTAPLHKEALAAAGAPFDAFAGHTELLQAEAARWLGLPLDQVPVRMMLANGQLRVVLVSIHVPLREAIAGLTFDRLLETITITHRALNRMLDRRPRIAVAGLNPHAGEGGLFGSEEIEIIGPAVQAARSEGIDVQGPFAPDTVFMRARDGQGKVGEFDVVVAMHHDQGLIPVKYLGIEEGVNVTLGLPFVRTSPDHGTAFDIAGTGRASAASFIAALRMAREMAA
jgi:4-hydroxythreonine-4-phosphate dehydrogenase